MRFILVVGLPGSGKSTWAKQKASECDANFIDDPKSYNFNIGGDWVFDFIVTRSITFIADPFFCVTKIRRQAKEILLLNYPGCTVDAVYFENNLEQCLDNSKLRSDKKVEGLTRALSASYLIPDDETQVIIPVYKPSFSAKPKA